MEKWKDIKDFEGLYQISSIGRVKALNWHREKKEEIKNQRVINGYKYINLYKNGKGKAYRVHILVAQAFLPVPEELKEYTGTRYLQVNHKNEDKTDNSVENLEWCDAKYNVNYGGRNERAGKSLKNGKKSVKIYQYTTDGQLVKIWESLRECERNGFDRRHISACCKHLCHYNKHKGYKWSFEPL